MTQALFQNAPFRSEPVSTTMIVWYTLTMDRADRLLMVSGALGVLSLIASTASLTIALVAAANPAVTTGVAPEIAAAALEHVNLHRWRSGLQLLFSCYAMASVLRRRVAFASDRSMAQWRSSMNWEGVAVQVGVFTLAVVVLARAIAEELEALGASPAPIASHPAFIGLSNSLGMGAMFCTCLCLFTLGRWQCRKLAAPTTAQPA